MGFDFNDYINIFDKDITCADFTNQVFQECLSDAAERQDDWLHMAGTLEERPVIKDSAQDVLGQVFDDDIAWVRECFVFGMLYYYRDKCDMGIEGDVAHELSQWLGEE